MTTLQQLAGHAWPMPHNPAYQPILADHATILGKRSPSSVRTVPGRAGACAGVLSWLVPVRG